MSGIERRISRREFLNSAAVGAVFGWVSRKLERRHLFHHELEFVPGQTLAPLRVLAAQRGMLYGAAAGYGRLRYDKRFSALVAAECSLLTPPVELRWDRTRPVQTDPYDFGQAEWMVEFCRRHDMKLRGHPLVWHSDIPEWIEQIRPPRVLARELESHIQAVVTRFSGSVHSWDVVNEAILPADRRADGLRESFWLRRLGPEYIDIAFHAAANADRRALLILNENRIDGATRDQERRRAKLLNLLEDLVARGVPIHGLGIQAHLVATSLKLDSSRLRQFVNDVASLGLCILITELDVADVGLPANVEARDRLVGDVYRAYLSAVLEEPAVLTVSTWGLSDRYTWLNERRPRRDGLHIRALPFDRSLRRKVAWTAIAEAITAAPERHWRSADGRERR